MALEPDFLAGSKEKAFPACLSHVPQDMEAVKINIPDIVGARGGSVPSPGDVSPGRMGAGAAVAPESTSRSISEADEAGDLDGGAGPLRKG